MSNIPDYVQMIVARLIGEPKKDDRVFTRLSDNQWTDGIAGGVYYEEDLERRYVCDRSTENGGGTS